MPQHATNIEHLKHLNSLDGVTSEIKFNGIPSSTTENVDSLANKLLDTLSLTSLKIDILNVRRIYPKFSFSSESSSSNSSQNHSKNFSIVIEFKSKEIKQHVLYTKRKHGTLDFCDLVKGGNSSTITIFEMHSSSVFHLFNSAKKLGQEFNYESIWAANGFVYVQKNDNADIIHITSELDLNKTV